MRSQTALERRVRGVLGALCGAEGPEVKPFMLARALGSIVLRRRGGPSGMLVSMW